MADFITVKILGFKVLQQNLAAIQQEIEDKAPGIVEEAAEIPMAMMRRLVPKNTHKLERSIRFTLGKGAGAVKISKPSRGRGSKGLGKARVIGYIVAGDQTTLVKGAGHSTRMAAGKRRSRGHSSSGMWQNALLQEYGTQKMKAKPFFFPSWRAMRPQFKKFINNRFREIIRQAKKQQAAEEKAAA